MPKEKRIRGTEWGHHSYEEFRACPRRFYINHILGYESPAGSSGASLGTAWHAWVRTFKETGRTDSADKAARISIEEERITYTILQEETLFSEIRDTLMRLSAEYPAWDSQWQKQHGKITYLTFEKEGESAVESSALPGYEATYTVRLDAFVKWNGNHWVSEIKSGALSWDRLLRMHLLGGQCSGYIHDAQFHEYKCHGVLLEQARTNIKDPKKFFNRKPILRPKYIVDHWKDSIVKTWIDIQRAAKDAEIVGPELAYEQRFDSCVGYIFACPFIDACLAKNLQESIIVLENFYRKKES